MQKFSKVFTLMVAMLALAYCAVSCKVNVDDEPTLYTVTVASSIEHGKVSIDKSSHRSAEGTCSDRDACPADCR